MGRIFVAVRAFFRTLFNGELAAQVGDLLAGRLALPAPQAETPPKKEAAPARPRPPARSEAVTLLATLQREGRLIDFLKQPLDGFSDAQIGAVVRDVHRDCAAALERLFGVEPLASEQEGAPVDVPQGFDAGQYHLVGNVAGQPPFHGKLTHHGWRATRCELPKWTGSDGSALVVAPAEVEL